MNTKKLQTLCFLALLALPCALWGQSDPQLKKTTPQASEKLTATEADTTTTSTENESPSIIPNQCQVSSQFSSVSYSELKTKLEQALQQKNKSSIFLELRTLQAQVDVLVSHLLSLDMSSKSEAEILLKKNLAYLEKLEALLLKSKATARKIKEEHVIPLATMTSLKADDDKCQGIDSSYRTIFKSLSQLNMDLTEILIISQQKVIYHKIQVREIINNIDNLDTEVLSVNNLSSHLNFIQNQINSITGTFQFDVKILSLASTSTN